jgi:hypothetical protein
MPYTTPEIVKELVGEDNFIAYAPQGAPDVDAYYVRRIEEGDLWLDGMMRKAGKSVPVDVSDPNSPAAITLRYWAAVVVLYRLPLWADAVPPELETAWKLLREWLACGANFGADDPETVLQKVIFINPAEICPPVSPKVFTEVVPCVADPRCRPETCWPEGL